MKTKFCYWRGTQTYWWKHFIKNQKRNRALISN